MAKHVWTVLCRQAIVDEFTKNASLVETIDEIAFAPAGELPDAWSNLPLEAVFVSFVTRSDPNVPERSRLKVELFAPNGEANQQVHTVEVDLTNHKRARTVFQFKALPVREFGIHTFVFSLEASDSSNKWAKVAEIPLEYKRQEVPVAELPATQVTVKKRAKKRT